ncbi:hypothetical protein BJN45_13180 [Azonexus hydrophilus]|uniref:Uncharacterized protein n=1 Tax=Azonexus hydrophilus TaxID=418702 RepID=A0A1R1I343_9RHOO|nr:hypothetical protein BJN45_13180 [Azonexus hydrophilus]
MPTYQPLGHLSEAELLELMSRYYAGERVATLLEQYRVNCSASTLCSHFPPEPSAELCQYCNAPMVRPRRSKSWSSGSTLRCSQCAHIESSRCACTGCKFKRLREEDLRVQQQHTKIQQFCFANWAYTPTQIQPEQLTARQAVALICLVRSGGWLDDSRIGPLSTSGIRFAPYAPDFQGSLIECLITADLLSPDPTSPSKAFTERGGQIVGMDFGQTHWVLRMPDGVRFVQALEIYVAAEDWPNDWGEECCQIWRELAFAECWEFCVYSLHQRNLPIPGATALTTLIENLLRDFSVSQFYQFLWACAGDAVDYRARKGVTAPHASNYMIASCQRRADRARAEGWKIKGFRRNFELSRTQISYVLHDMFFKHGENGFTCRADVPLSGALEGSEFAA